MSQSQPQQFFVAIDKGVPLPPARAPVRPVPGVRPGVGPREFTAVAIDKGVPLAPGRRCWKYPWDAMDLGDSVFAAGLNLNTAQSVLRRTNLRRAPKRWCWRKVRGGVRFYRIA